jgi:NADH:ubiquinone oxidoreductase subunit D/NADH:ubiquinone oxidoreductase subunit C
VEAVKGSVEYLVRSVVTTGRGRIVVEGIPKLLGQALTTLKDHGLCLDLLSLCVVDLTSEGGGMQLVHHLSSPREGVIVELWTRLSGGEAEEGEAAPAGELVAPSCARLWPSAVWLEREAWELHGVVFDGHPGLERLLLPPWWVGHPLRRDEARNRTSMVTAAADGPTEPSQEAPVTTGAKGPTDWAPIALPLAAMGGTVSIEVRSQGGKVTAARVGPGHLHRGVEGLAEARTWDGGLALAARTAVRSSVHWQVAYASAVEQLTGLQVPQRGLAMRVALMELERISDHMLAHATMLELLGCHGPASRVWADRELVMDAMQAATGGRVVHDCIAIGGMRADAPPGWPERLGRVAELAGEASRQYVREALGLPPWRRLEGLSPVHPDHMPGWGLSGVLVRASGMSVDARKDGRVGGYADLPLDVQTLTGSDAVARAELRMLEIAASARLLAHLSKAMPGGRVREEMHEEVPPGRAVGVVEDPRGELHCTVVSSGLDRPRRVHFRSPDLAHAAALGEVLLGVPADDVALAVVSVDICVGGVDR